MTMLAPVLQSFFTDRLQKQRRASPHTIAAYRDTFRLLLLFAQERLTKAPTTVCVADLDAALIAAFLDHLEVDRTNTPRTRNARLAAIRAPLREIARRVGFGGDSGLPGLSDPPKPPPAGAGRQSAGRPLVT